MTEPFKVDFIIVGAQKCGTTSLTAMLRRHPSIVGSRKKETDFFVTCKDWRAELPQYESFFEKRPGAIYFEASPKYTFHPERKLWIDLHAYNPQLKIIYLVRHPLQRITSAYMHYYERGRIDLSFEQAITDAPLLMGLTRYATQIQPFISQFGANRVSIRFFEDLVRDPNEFIRDLADFIEVDPGGFGDVSNIHANKSIGGRKLHHKYDNPGFFLRQIRRFFPFWWRAITDNSKRAFAKKPRLPIKLQQVVLQTLEPEIKQLEILTN